MSEKIIPDGYKLVAVKGLDELVYWLERCKDKGHIENCADLIEPFEAFEYRNVSEESVISAHEAKAAPAVPQGEPEAYMVYGNYTRQPFRSIESAQAYMGGLLKSDPEGGYHIRPLFYATPAAPSQEPAVPQGWRDFLTELSKQKPEKPDYWSSCGQCERNSSTAEDLIAATPAPAPAQGEPFGYFRAEPFGWTDCAATDEGAIALYERPAAPAAPAAPDVMSILRAIHRRPSDAGIWLNDITRILRDAPAPAVPQGVLADMREFASAKLPEFLGPHHMALTLSQKINEWADLLAAAPQGEPSLDLIAVCKEVSAMAVYVGDGECSIQFAIIQRLDAALAATLAAPSQEPAVNLSCKSTQARLAAQWGYVPAPSQEPAVPQGWKLVPIEPTPEMGRAYLEAAKIHAAEGAEDKMRFSPGGYAAMLSAAPSQPVTLTDEEIDKVALEATGYDGFGTQPMNSHDLRNVVHGAIAALREKQAKATHEH